MRIKEKKKAEEWRHKLKLGDRIDAVKGDLKCKCWSRGTIVEIKEDQDEDFLRVEFELESSLYDKSFGRWSSDIAQLDTYSKENDWKLDLKVGDLVDAHDKVKQWYASTIIDVQDIEVSGRKYKNFNVGFRVYLESGSKTDNDGNKYEGWSTKFDEWISQFSPKIAKLHTFSKPLTGGKKVYKSYEEQLIDDQQDPIVEEGEEPIFAVIRPKKNRSTLLIHLLNVLG